MRLTRILPQWTGVVFAPTARYLFDPGYKAGAEPACVELKLVSRAANQDRGYILLSITDDAPTVIEFAVEGSTKTDRALAEIPGILPAKFMRFGPTFIAMEDANGNLLGTWGSLPISPDEPAPANPHRFTGEYLSETGIQTPLEITPACIGRPSRGLCGFTFQDRAQSYPCRGTPRPQHGCA
jgi:hypothetical protein